MKRSLILAALIAAACAAPLPSMAGNIGLYISAAPPAPLYERIPAARHGYVWAPGHWEWNGRRHNWAPGFWVVERPGYAYNAPSWYQRDGGWYMEPARWTAYGGRDRDRDGIPDRYETRLYDNRGDNRGGYDRGHAYGGHDRDRDGVPDRYEHGRGGRADQDHDGVPNRYDRDRDGDGVPNRADRRPDNGWRR